ncbi:ImmA/IrrE family metallo-endopeptidase [Clostridioides difficile]
MKKTRYFWRIEMIAENILKHHECYNSPYNSIDIIIESFKIDLIPIDVDNDKLMGIFGDDNNGHRFIAYNKNMILERILFTKAHELGHFILKHKLKGDILTDNEDEPKDPQETEANVFSSALLMPKVLIVKIVKKNLLYLKIPLDNEGAFDYDTLSKHQQDFIIQEVKSMFHTSKEAIEWRIRNLFGSKKYKKL